MKKIGLLIGEIYIQLMKKVLDHLKPCNIQKLGEVPPYMRRAHPSPPVMEKGTDENMTET